MVSIDNFIREVDRIETEQEAKEKLKKQLENEITEIGKNIDALVAEKELTEGAIAIIKNISDNYILESYSKIEDTVNRSLERIFTNSSRRIKINQKTMAGKYPQLWIELHTPTGVRSIKNESGHGIAQIISLICTLNIIAMSGQRRLMVMDEVLSGVSKDNRYLIADIMWAYTNIGFQFIINEHGYIPRGAKVYELKVDNNVSSVVSVRKEESADD